MNSIFLFKSLVLFISLGIALYQDLRQHKIKNYITLPTAFLGISLNALEKGTFGMMLSLAGWVVPLVFLMIFYLTNIMGAGDIKLFAAIGSLMGLPFIFYSFIFSVLIGGFIAFLLLLTRGTFWHRMTLVYTYLCFTLATRKMTVYSAKEDGKSKFAFSSAIVPGTIIQYCLTVFS